MRTIGDFNKISNELKKRIPPFDSVVVFELLGGDKDPNTGVVYHGGAISWPARDRILDGSNVVEIGIPRVIDNGKVKKVEDWVLANNENGRVATRFELRPDVVRHQEWYEFFMVCNYNQDSVNPKADKTVKKLFRVIDTQREAKQYNNSFDSLADAIFTAKNMSLEECRLFCAAMNWDYNGTEEATFQRVRSYAQNNPVDFMQRAKNSETKEKAEFRKAIDKGVISYDKMNHAVKWPETGTVVAKLDRVEGEDWLDTFHRHLKSVKNGEDIVNQIRKKLLAVLEIA